MRTTDLASTSDYLVSQHEALESLMEALHAEIKAYRSIAEKFNEQAIKKTFTDMSYFMMCEWDDRIKDEIESLILYIMDYLQRQDKTFTSTEMNSASLKISGYRKKCFAIIEIVDEINQTEILRLDTRYAKDINVLSDENKHLVTQVNYLRKTRLDKSERFEKTCAPLAPSVVQLQEDTQPPFKNYRKVGNKIGGANFAGDLGGWYEHIHTRKRALFKMESAIEKVMGEFLAGTVLKEIYAELHVLDTRFAHVSLIRPQHADKDDKSGKDVYVKSEGIPDYQCDLWEYNWRDDESKPASRPAAFTRRHRESLSRTDEFIEDAGLQAEFAELAAPRLLLGDFGLHNGNFGVAHDKNGNPHIVALDYGAAFYNFNAELKPFLPFSLPSSGKDFYKNHFLEYGDKIHASEEMAKVLIKIGKMDRSIIKKALNKGLDEISDFYNAKGLIKFCQRLGMHPLPAKKQGLKKIKGEIAEFIMKQIKHRQTALKEQGYGLLLEHCVTEENGNITVNVNKLHNRFSQSGQELRDYIDSESFKNYRLVYHKQQRGFTGLHDHGIPVLATIEGELIKNNDNPIIESIRDAAKQNPELIDNIIRRRNFFSRNLLTIVRVAAIWASAGAMMGFLASGTTLGISAPLLTFIGALAGAVIGFGIGVISCVIAEATVKCCAATSASSTHHRVHSTLNKNPSAAPAPSVHIGSSIPFEEADNDESGNLSSLHPTSISTSAPIEPLDSPRLF